MIQFIKKAFFGTQFFQRTSSAEVESKQKKSAPKKKPLSFDSKQKEKDDALKTSKRNQHPEVIVHDDTATIKKYSGSKDYVENPNINRNFSIVSDAEDEPQSPKNRLVTFPNISDSSKKGCVPETERQSSMEGVKKQQSSSNNIELGVMKSSIIPQRNGKILISRERSAVKVKRVGEKCVICERTLTLEDSFQLACSHRCHKECGIQMQWRFRYNCDACEVKKDHKRCSIILSMRRRRGNR